MKKINITLVMIGAALISLLSCQTAPESSHKAPEMLRDKPFSADFLDHSVTWSYFPETDSDQVSSPLKGRIREINRDSGNSTGLGKYIVISASLDYFWQGEFHSDEINFIISQLQSIEENLEEGQRITDEVLGRVAKGKISPQGKKYSYRFGFYSTEDSIFFRFLSQDASLRIYDLYWYNSLKLLISLYEGQLAPPFYQEIPFNESLLCLAKPGSTFRFPYDMKEVPESVRDKELPMLLISGWGNGLIVLDEENPPAATTSFLCDAGKVIISWSKEQTALLKEHFSLRKGRFYLAVQKVAQDEEGNSLFIVKDIFPFRPEAGYR